MQWDLYEPLGPNIITNAKINATFVNNAKKLWGARGDLNPLCVETTSVQLV